MSRQVILCCVVLLLLGVISIIAQQPPPVPPNFSTFAWVRRFDQNQDGSRNFTQIGTFFWKFNAHKQASIVIGSPLEEDNSTEDSDVGRFNHLLISGSATVFSFDPTSQQCDSKNGCLEGKCCDSDPQNGTCACLIMNINRFLQLVPLSVSAGKCVVGPAEAGSLWRNKTKINPIESMVFEMCYSMRLNAPAWVNLYGLIEANQTATGVTMEFSDWNGSATSPDSDFDLPSYCKCPAGGAKNGPVISRRRRGSAVDLLWNLRNGPFFF